AAPRGLLDPLASRRTDPTVAAAVASTRTSATHNAIPAGIVGASGASGSATGAIAGASLPTRGASAGTDPVAPYLAGPAALDVESPHSAASPTIDEIIATAGRVRSTLLVYWVGERATIAWVITPSGRIHSTTINIDSKKLS